MKGVSSHIEATIGKKILKKMTYYDRLLTDLQKYKKIEVFPVLYGLYEWTYYDTDHFLLREICDKSVYERAVVDKECNVQSKRLSNYVAPRKTEPSTIIKALQKMDDGQRIDGVCLLICDEHLIILESYTCYSAKTQFIKWLENIVPMCAMIEDLQLYVDMPNTDVKSFLFAHKYLFYALNLINVNNLENWKFFLSSTHAATT